MGFVLLDLTFRVEKAFGVRVPRDWMERLGMREAGDDVTLARYHAFVVELCEEQGVMPPSGSWGLLLRVVGDATGAREEELKADTWLVREVAPEG